MDIHKPKPIHSWRDLGTEIGVIVIGILIALGLEQVVEEYHARSELAETRSVIAEDLKRALAGEAMLERSAKCQERQFAALNAAVGHGDLARANKLMGMSSLYAALPVSDAVWTTALASDVTYGMTPEERDHYNGAYFLARRQGEFQVAFFRSQARFDKLVGSDLSASPDAPGRALDQLVEMEAIADNSRGVMFQLRRTTEQVLGKVSVEPEPWQATFIAQCETAADAMSGKKSAT